MPSSPDAPACGFLISEVNGILRARKSLPENAISRSDVVLIAVFELANMPFACVDVTFSSHAMSALSHEGMVDYLHHVAHMTRDYFFFIGNGPAGKAVSDLVDRQYHFVEGSGDCKPSAAQVTVSGPDLVETAVSDPPTTVTLGGTFSVTDRAQNIGTVSAAASTTRYYLSTAPSKSRTSILLAGSRSVPSLTPTATSSGNASVTVPSTLPSGGYFLLACADDKSVVSETNETSNCKASATTAMH